MEKIRGDGMQALSISELMMHRAVITHPDVPPEIWEHYKPLNFDSSDGIAVHPEGVAKFVSFYKLPKEAVAKSRNKQTIELAEKDYDAIEGKEFAPRAHIANQLLPLGKIGRNYLWNALATTSVLEIFLGKYARSVYSGEAMGIYGDCLDTEVIYWVPWTFGSEERCSCLGAFRQMNSSEGLILAALSIQCTDKKQKIRFILIPNKLKLIDLEVYNKH
jgi:hypothetical protein